MGQMAVHVEPSYDVNMSRIVEWNGQNVPEEMRSLPPGRYVVEAMDETNTLTADEEDGIRQALASLEAGRGSPIEKVRERTLRALKR